MNNLTCIWHSALGSFNGRCHPPSEAQPGCHRDLGPAAAAEGLPKLRYMPTFDDCNERALAGSALCVLAYAPCDSRECDSHKWKRAECADVYRSDPAHPRYGVCLFIHSRHGSTAYFAGSGASSRTCGSGWRAKAFSTSADSRAAPLWCHLSAPPPLPPLPSSSPKMLVETCSSPSLRGAQHHACMRASTHAFTCAA